MTSNDRLLTWCQERKADLAQQLEMLRSGTMGTHEARHGREVDTTQETIARLERWVADLDALLQHRGASGLPEPLDPAVKG